jgi:large subunit ribosomal protein L19e
MTDLANQRRMAAELLGVGRGRVYINPLHNDDVAEAVTRADIRALIRKGLIETRSIQGTSRVRARKLAEQKQSGRRRGPGSRKGAKGARTPRKARWMRLIRPVRQELARLREEKKITPTQYRVYYRKAKGGAFRSRAHLISHLKTDGVLVGEVA